MIYLPVMLVDIGIYVLRMIIYLSVVYCEGMSYGTRTTSMQHHHHSHANPSLLSIIIPSSHAHTYIHIGVYRVPVTSPFAAALGYLQQREPVIEKIVEDSVEDLVGLVERLSRMGLGEAVRAVYVYMYIFCTYV